MTRQRVLFVTTDPLTEAMPGPAIRAWHLAAELASDHDVTLVSSVACTRAHSKMDVRYADDSTVAELGDWMTVVVGPGSVVARYPCFRTTDKPVVVDIYDPYHLENLAVRSSGIDDSTIRHLTDVVNQDLARGDFFLCASERQRDFWLGSLAAVGRINTRTHEGDEGLERLLAVVPFGVPSHPPGRSGPGLEPLIPGGLPRWPIVLWGGGVYDWFDPVTMLRAVHGLRGEFPEILLVFMGMGHPNPSIPEMPVAQELRRLAGELDMEWNVVFNREWVPYEKRAAVLLDATVGVSTNLEHLEARFSFRTRVLDYLWAGLPTVVTRGDVLSELIEREGIGVAVRPGDVEGVADGLRRMILSAPSAEAVRAVSDRFRWDRVAEPLARYCDDPWRAADRAAPPSAPATAAPPRGARERTALRRLAPRSIRRRLRGRER